MDNVRAKEPVNPVTMLTEGQIKDPMGEYESNEENRYNKKWSLRRCSQKKQEEDLSLVDNITRLLASSDDITSESVKSTVNHYINLQRIVENTNARKRLERWAKKVIVRYLIAVFAILVLSHVHIGDGKVCLSMSDTVIITLLTTTTVNILGLGFIVLKGHFPRNGGEDCNEEKLSTKFKDSSIKS